MEDWQGQTRMEDEKQMTALEKKALRAGRDKMFDARDKVHQVLDEMKTDAPTPLVAAYSDLKEGLAWANALLEEDK